MAVRKGALAFGITLTVLLLLVLAEISVIIWVAGEIGWWTLVILMASTVLGLYLMQREWRKAWASLAESLRSGQLPTGRMANASLVLAGGILLTLPGLITDVLGLILLVPFTRPFVRSGLTWWVSRVAKNAPGGPVIIKGEATEKQPETLIPGIQETDDEAADGMVIRGDLDDEQS